MPENKAPVAGSNGADGQERPEGPVRMCVICRRRLAKAELKRHVLTAQGNLSIDAKKTRPGRGWYVCSDPVCEQKFAKYRPGTRRAAATRRKTRGTAGDSLDKGGKHA